MCMKNNNIRFIYNSNAYTVRYGNCNDLNTNLSSIVVRLSNVIMKW